MVNETKLEENLLISKPKIIKIRTSELVLDLGNPRILEPVKSQDEIRKYLLKNEDVAELAQRINRVGILPGDVLVVIEENNQYVVMEGNRRAAAIQMMLDRSLIPPGETGIPDVGAEIKEIIQEQDAHIVENRKMAERMMATRHIEGVKRWKTIAKQNFFYSRFERGSSIRQLSEQTGISASDIRKHIRQYGLFIGTYEDYKKENPRASMDITKIKVDPFVRPFTVATLYKGTEIHASDLLEITYDEKEKANSGLGEEWFKKIKLQVFEEAIFGSADTRLTLTEIKGVKELIDAAKSGSLSGGSRTTEGGGQGGMGTGKTGGGEGGGQQGGMGTGETGGPAQGKFFEDIVWKNRLNSKNKDDVSLLVVLKELYVMSTKHIGKKAVFEEFPIAAAMLMRSAYEQAIWVLLKRTKLIKDFMQEYNPKGTKNIFMLSDLEEFLSKRISTEPLIIGEIRKQFSAVQRNEHRDILNDIVHIPGKVKPTPEMVECLCKGGLLYFIQEVIDLN